MYLSRASPNERVWHKAFLKLGLDTKPQPTRVRSFAKNTFGNVGIPLNRGASGSRQ